ncbi:MAG TPA: molybdopterin molybdotransferase MoeA [Puia sp.]|jgi:molybdopterin molybdotransferase|nr:molybdopterin molybdotransferase MoeA [Puia sp.]
MVSFQEAQGIVVAQARSFGVEEIPLGLAGGRVLAEPIRADRDYPPFPRAVMDGYALGYDDLQRGVRRFKVVETLLAGSQANGRIRSGECYKIMTGAAVPQDADMVIRREDVEENGEWMDVGVKEPEPWRPYLNIARQGEDLKKGDVVIDKPCRCEPAVMGLLASVGYATVKVARIPRVAVVTTGDEVVNPGMPVSPVQIRNSNRWMLEAALRREGVGLEGSGHASDCPQTLTRALQGFISCDILIITGGVSAGDADYVPQVLEELGVRRLFHKIAMRPGKPTWCGVIPEGTGGKGGTGSTGDQGGAGGGIVFALPGNPFSCLVNFALLIAPYLRACWGLERAAPMSLPLTGGRKKRTPLDEFFPVRIEGAPAKLTQMPLNGSGDIRLGMQANALGLHPAESGDLESGTEVTIYSFV